MDAFRLNMADAHALVTFAEAFVNQRRNRMRAELRERVGHALRVPVRDRPNLDCLQSRDVFITFMPGGRLDRDDFHDLSPLLRQAIVAGCAATETYLADKVIQRVAAVLWKNGDLPRRLGDLGVTVGEVVQIEKKFTNKKRALRERVIAPVIRERSSTASNRVGELLSMVGVRDWSRTLDSTRKVKRGATVATLDRITARRNKIAHEGDRRGHGRARITVQEVNDDLDCLTTVVEAIEQMLADT